MHIYKYAQSHIIHHQHVLVTSVTIIRDSCNKKTINTITVQKCMTNPLNFYDKSYDNKDENCIISLHYI